MALREVESLDGKTDEMGFGTAAGETKLRNGRLALRSAFGIGHRGLLGLEHAEMTSNKT